jgi:hypothetical protein
MSLVKPAALAFHASYAKAATKADFEAAAATLEQAPELSTAERIAAVAVAGSSRPDIQAFILKHAPTPESYLFDRRHHPHLQADAREDRALTACALGARLARHVGEAHAHLLGVDAMTTIEDLPTDALSSLEGAIDAARSLVNSADETLRRDTHASIDRPGDEHYPFLRTSDAQGALVPLETARAVDGLYDAETEVADLVLGLLDEEPVKCPTEEPAALLLRAPLQAMLDAADHAIRAARA